MIPVANPIPEPGSFDANCRQVGNNWLALNPNARPGTFPNHWVHYENDLAVAFHYRCGWLAIEITEGDVDHYLSKKNHRDQTYEWSNYRYIAGTVNSSKRNLDNQVIDPFEVRPAWFALGLPDLKLRPTNAVPPSLQTKAEFTIEKLKLNSRKHRRTRLRHYNRHKSGLMPIALLSEMNLLLAEALNAYRTAHPGEELP